EGGGVVGDHLGVGVALLVDAKRLIPDVAAHQLRHRRRVVGALGQGPRQAICDVNRLDREVGEPESELLIIDRLQQVRRSHRVHSWYLAGLRSMANRSSRSLSTLR